MAEYDVVVVGGGPTGENVADYAVRAGLSAALVENELFGGECSYWACIPSKAMLRPGAALTEARNVKGAAQAVTGRLDARAVIERRDSFTGFGTPNQDAGQVRWAENAGIHPVRGWGRLAGPRRVEVTHDGETQVITARHAVVLATGTGAVIPPIDGLAEARPWISRDATSSGSVPGRLAVIGGGVVAAEMATAWNALGSQVTMLVRDDGILLGMEPFAGEAVTAALRAAGVDVRFGAESTKVSRNGVVTLSLNDGSTLECDEVLAATGRFPKTRDVGLETVGLEPGGWLEVDDTCRVTAMADGWLYAAGDLNHRALLTHMGKYQARACAAAIAERAAGRAGEPARYKPWAATADHTAVPQVVFTDPEVSAVGLTEAMAEREGLNIRVVEFDIGKVAGAALYADGYQGHAKLVVDEDRSVVVGAAFVGPGVGEMVHAATVAVVGEVPMDRLWHAVPAYPSISELWLRLLEEYHKR